MLYLARSLLQSPYHGRMRLLNAEGKALELLKSRRMPVTQVAEAVGYSHAASFTAAFRRFYGFVPKSAHTEVH